MLIYRSEIDSCASALQDSIPTRYSIVLSTEFKVHYLERVRFFHQRWLILLLPFGISIDLLNRKLTLFLALELKTGDRLVGIEEGYCQINL